MKKNILLLFLAYIQFIFPNLTKAQWKHIDIPVGQFAHYENIEQIAFSGKNIFAGTISTGMYISNNCGNNWERIESIFKYDRTRVIESFGNKVYVAAFNGEIYRSTDNGDTWNFFYHQKFVNLIYCSNNIIFVGTINNGVYRSTDDGNKWTKIEGSLRNKQVNGIIGLENKYYACTNEGVFVSENNGESWVNFNNSLGNKDVKAIAALGPDLFVSCGGTDVFISTNEGLNWELINEGLTCRDAEAFAISDMDVYLYTKNEGIFKLSNTKKSWIKVNSPEQILTLNFADGRLFAGTKNGIYISENSGLNWTQKSFGLDRLCVSSFAQFGSDLYLCSGNGVYHSTDIGESWREINNGLTADQINSIVKLGENLFAGTEMGVFRLNNYSTSWEALTNGLPKINVSALATTDNKLMAGTWGMGIYISSDNGETWDSTSNEGLDVLNIYSLTCTDSIIYAGTYGYNNFFGGLFRSNNYGKSWEKINTGYFNPRAVRSVEVSGSNLFAGSCFTGGIYFSTDNGASWVSKDLSNAGIMDIAISGSNVFAGTLKQKLYISTDYGNTWINDDELPNTEIMSVVVMDGYILAGTWGEGVWKRQLTELITNKDNELVKAPINYELSQNYPNPFNPTTTISFALPEKSFVSIKIFDVLGKEVKNLVEGEFQAGSYQKEWTALGYSSGVYLYRMKAGQFCETRKLLLLK